MMYVYEFRHAHNNQLAGVVLASENIGIGGAIQRFMITKHSYISQWSFEDLKTPANSAILYAGVRREYIVTAFGQMQQGVIV